MKAQDKLEVIEKLKEEREISDTTYAPIIVKTIVFSFLGLICIAFVTFLTKMIWPH